jgi:Rrf2 family protein
MRLSRAGDYGLRVVLALARRRPGDVVSVRTLSREQGVPAAFLAKVVGALTEAGIVRTSRGATGGTALARDAATISVLQVVEAIDGPIVLNYCLDCPTACRFTTDCVVMETWQEAQARLRETLADANFADLARRAAARAARSSSGVVDSGRENSSF